MPDKTLSVKQTKFIKGLQKYQDPAKAYVRAYGSKGKRLTNQKNASQVWRYIKKNYDLPAILEQYGLGLAPVMDKFQELLGAKKPVIKDGEIVDHYPDNIVQFNTAKEVAGMHGVTKREGDTNILNDNRQQSIIVQVAAQCDISKMREKEEKIKLTFVEGIQAQVK